MKKILFLLFIIALISNCAVNVDAKSKKSKIPEWLSNPKKVYPDQLYLTAIGEGDTRADAENMAAANLSKIFESTIHAEENVNQRYTELTNAKGTEVSDYASVNKNVNISTSQKLFNIQFAQSYTDNNGIVHVLAYINRVQTSEIYQEKIEETSKRVKFYIKKYKTEKNPIKRYSYISAAKVFANKNKILLEQLSIIDANSKDLINLGYSYNDLTIMLSEAAKAVDFTISIKGDEQGRVSSILESILTDMGFVLGVNGILNIKGDVKFENTSLNRSDGFKFVRYTLSIKLTDDNNNVIVALNEKGREGHTTTKEAKERCIRKIEKKLKRNFKKKLIKYFDSLALQ